MLLSSRIIRLILISVGVIPIVALSDELGDMHKYRIPSDPKATYYMIVKDLGHGKEALRVWSLRKGSSGDVYSIRSVDCYGKTETYLGASTESFDGATKRINLNTPPNNLYPGSISYYIHQEACRLAK